MSEFRRRLLFAKLNNEDMKEFNLINKVTLEEAVSNFIVDTDSEGNEFECDELFIHFKCVAGDTGNVNITPSYSLTATRPSWFGSTSVAAAANATRYIDTHVYRVVDAYFEERNTYHVSETYQRAMNFTFLGIKGESGIKAMRFAVGNSTANILAGSEITIYGR